MTLLTLGEGREPTSDSNSIETGSLVEESAVIPPAFVLKQTVSTLFEKYIIRGRAYRSVELKEMFVFVELKLNPGRFWVIETMPFGEDGVCLLTLVASEEPSGRLGDKHAETDDETRENHLEPDGDDPRVVALNLKGPTSCTGSQDGASKPSGVAETGDDTTVFGVSGFDDPDRSCGSCDRHTKPENKSTAHHLTLGCIGGCKSLYDGTDNDQHAADEHANTTSPSVDGRTNEGKGGHTADLVHGADDTSPDTFILSVEVLQEVLLIVQETTQKHAVVAVHGLAEEADQENGKQLQIAGMGPGNWLTEQSLVEGFTTFDFLDFDDLEKNG